MLFVVESPIFFTHDRICPLNISDNGVRVKARLFARCLIFGCTCCNSFPLQFSRDARDTKIDSNAIFVTFHSESLSSGALISDAMSPLLNFLFFVAVGVVVGGGDFTGCGGLRELTPLLVVPSDN